MTVELNKSERLRVCKKLKEIRVHKGITQEEISLKTGLTRNNVSRIETGRYNIGIDIISAIATAMDYHLDLIPGPPPAFFEVKTRSE